MQLNVTCPTCGTSGVLPNARPGEAVACPQCKSVFTTSRPQTGTTDTPLPADVLGIWLGPAETVSDVSLPSTTTIGPTVSLQTPAPPPARPPAPPVAAPDGDAPSELVQGETRRINQYVARELGKLKQVRHQIVELQSKAETAAHARDMELNRRAAELSSRQSELDRREAALATATEALTKREAEAAQATAALSGYEARVRELEARRATLEAEVADLGRLAAELRPVVERLRVRREEDAAARAELAARQADLDRRMVEVGRTELALQTRLDELDRLEQELRSELENRERELERYRASIEEELRAARQPTVATSTPPPLPISDPDPSDWFLNDQAHKT